MDESKENKEVLVKSKFQLPCGQELQDLIQFCKIMGDCKFYKNLGPAGVMSIVLSAKEMGLPVMGCLNGGMHNVEGKVSLSAQFMNMLIVNKGHRADIVHLDEERCIICFTRKGEEKGQEYEYTIRDAEKANYLKKDNWKYHTRDMIFNRCLSSGARKLLPDAICGAYIEGEILSKNESKLSSKSVNTQDKIENKKELTQEQYEIANNFALENKIGLPNGAYNEYLDIIIEKSGMSKEKVLYSASENKEKFFSGFEKWSANQKAKSQDQVQSTS